MIVLWCSSLACVQMSVADREQEIMNAAGLSIIGGSGTVGHGVMERVLRIVPGENSLLCRGPIGHSSLTGSRC